MTTELLTYDDFVVTKVPSPYLLTFFLFLFISMQWLQIKAVKEALNICMS